MRNIIKLLILIPLALSGCNLPAQPTLVPTVDVLATQVSQKLTQAPAIATTATPALKPTSTSSLAKPTATLSAPTQTVAPSATPTLAISATATLASPTPNSSAATTTPTGIPGDPRTDLGTPTWKDNFQKASAWGLDSPYDDGHTRVSITPGKIILTSIEANKWHGWRMYTTKIQNFYLEATIQPLTCSGEDLYGLVFRSPDGSKGYWFGFTCDGRYNLISGDVNNLVDIIKLKTSSLIKSGSNQVNRLGVMAKGNKIGLYANGKLLEEVSSDAITTSGMFGYYIKGAKTVNFTYESTELAYWKLP